MSPPAQRQMRRERELLCFSHHLECHQYEKLDGHEEAKPTNSIFTHRDKPSEQSLKHQDKPYTADYRVWNAKCKKSEWLLSAFLSSESRGFLQATSIWDLFSWQIFCSIHDFKVVE